MTTSTRSLDAEFAQRAIPIGSARHWSYVFAPPLVRAPLLGIYALLAEWHALLDPLTERNVAELKLAWWQQEMSRSVHGNPVHPLSRHLASLPGACAAHFQTLSSAVDAAVLELRGVPLELGSQLEPHSSALLAGPLRVAASMGTEPPRLDLPEADLEAAPAAGTALDRCSRNLAAGHYLARALRGYRRAALVGRVPFAVDELLQAGVESNDLLMEQAPPRLQAYLDGVRDRADAYYAEAAQVPRPASANLRHLLVLAALGRRQLDTQGDSSKLTALKDMLLAWTTARRAGL